VDYKRENLRIEVEGLRSASTIPLILKKVLKIVEDERSTPADLEEVIKHDQSIVSRIVGMANAAFYRQSRRVGDISHAILILGFDMVKSIAISVTVFNMLKVNQGEISRLWSHSFEVAVLARVLAEKTGHVPREMAFLAGLLHDIGRALLFQLFDEQYLRICKSGNGNLLERERESFGAPHPEVGAWFTEKYLLPRECIIPIQFHHAPEMCLTNELLSSAYLVYILYLADYIVSKDKEGFEADGFVSPQHQEIIEVMGLADSWIDHLEDWLGEIEETTRDFYELINGVGQC